jgi:hypothetical protein
MAVKHLLWSDNETRDITDNRRRLDKNRNSAQKKTPGLLTVTQTKQIFSCSSNFQFHPLLPRRIKLNGSPLFELRHHPQDDSSAGNKFRSSTDETILALWFCQNQ